VSDRKETVWLVGETSEIRLTMIAALRMPTA
jgi:hypothetical protein